MDDEPLFTYEVTRPGRLVSLNENLTWHRQQTSKGVWMQAGWAVGNVMKAELRERRVRFPLPRCRIQFDVDVTTSRRRDGHNFALPAKWFIDGMVLAKVFTDDTSEHLALDDWTFTKVTRTQPKLRVTVREA